MVHGLKEFRVGDVRNAMADMDAMNKTVDIQCAMLSSRSKLPDSHWREMLCDQLPHYYTAEEALKAGLIDAIV